MEFIEKIRSCSPILKNRKLILKSFGIKKARSGTYSDNPVNRKLKRVGQKYGTKKQEEQPGDKVKKQDQEVQGKQHKFDEKKITQYAKKATDEQLKAYIEKQDKHPEIANIAKKELEGRNKEGGNDKISKQITDIENKIKELRSKDTSDLDEIEKISNDVQKLIGDRKRLIQERDDLRKVPFKEYMSGFKDYSKEDPKKVGEYYGKEVLKIDKYLEKNKEINDSINFYTKEGYKEVRNYLTDKENYLKSYPEKNRNTIDKENLQDINNISEFIQDNKIKDDLVLNRRVKGDGLKFFQQLEKGDIYEDKSFSSTSLRELTHFGDYNISILAKKDSNVANVSNLGEVEYLIDKDSKFRVLDKNDNGIIVELL